MLWVQAELPTLNRSWCLYTFHYWSVSLAGIWTVTGNFHVSHISSGAVKMGSEPALPFVPPPVGPSCRENLSWHSCCWHCHCLLFIQKNEFCVLNTLKEAELDAVCHSEFCSGSKGCSCSSPSTAAPVTQLQQLRKAFVGNGEWDPGKTANPGTQHYRRIDLTSKNCKLSYTSASKVHIFKDVR